MAIRDRQPIHPGEVLSEDILVELDMTGRELAQQLNVSPNRISEILRGRRAITADTALRLARWMGTSPQFWLNLQQAYDLEVAERDLSEIIAREVTPRTVA